MTETTDARAAERLVAEARGAVHGSLTFLAAPEADRVRALIAALETAVEGRTAIRMAAAPSAPADQTALRDRIAAALAAAEGWQWPPGFDKSQSPTYQRYLRQAAVVLAALPEPADRGAILREAADIADRLMDERYGPDCSYAIGGEDVARELRRMAAEAQQPACPGYETTPNRCTCDCEGCKHHCAAHQAVETQQSEPRPDTPRCAHCTHPKGDHSDRKDHTPSPTVPRRPWCHACNATCDYDEQPAGEAQQPETQAARRVLTPNEHDRAWHAIEGAAGDPGADPGTVLNAVLRALRIDAPTAEDEQAASPRRKADGTRQDETLPAEDPARIDRMRPEFTEHASVESIDVQLRRARSQLRRWHLRVEWLISLRQARVEQKERGEWPAAVSQPGKEATQ
jgi:hypothetical protein